MALPFYNWSRTAASNATADSTVNWAEGMAPSGVNDSGRAMMASTAAFRDDIAGAIATGGTSTAYTVTSYQVFDTLAHMDGQVIAFTPHATNGGACTLNVDGLGAKYLRANSSADLVSGVLIQGTPYIAVYNNADSAFYLHGLYGNPYNIPLGGGMMYFGTTAPNSSFVFPYGQAISRTTYSTLFTLFSTTFGVGDGSTTFNVPDLRGRVPAGKDDMGGTSAGRLTPPASGGVSDSTVLGSAGGSKTQTLVTANLPPYTPSGAVSLNVSGTIPVQGNASGTSVASAVYYGKNDTALGTLPVTFSSAPGFLGDAQGGSSTAFNLVQPTIICNYILRIL